MTRPYHFIEFERRGDVFCVRLSRTQLDELMIYELAGEMRRLVVEDGCRRFALSLGPEPPECLYSIFLAKLITLQRLLNEHQGELALCQAPPAVHNIFAACGLDQIFRFLPDFDTAIAYWTK